MTTTFHSEVNVKVQFFDELQKNPDVDVIVLPFWQDDCKPLPIFDKKNLHIPEVVFDPIELGDFLAKEDEIFLVCVKKQRFLLLGLGKKDALTPHRIRASFSCVSRKMMELGFEHISIIVTTPLRKYFRQVIEGVFLANYRFDVYKTASKKDSKRTLLKKIDFIGVSQEFGQKDIAFVKNLTSGVFLCRDLVNGNADDVTPEFLCKIAKSISNVKTTCHSKSWLEKEKMGLILAVSKGSHHEPRFIIMEYRGNKKSKERSCIVGKGITYDTGGLSIKQVSNMIDMKTDMAGAASVIGAIKALSLNKIPVNVIGIIPCCENAISSTSFKPGDVYTSYSGITVENTNPDAEGRLILADAIAYANKAFHPDFIVDFATLTGAIDIALGKHAIGLFSNDDHLAKKLTKAADRAGERAWQFPLYDEYKEPLKSEIADIKNWGSRSAGAIAAAKFIEEFVGKTPWAHFDIASCAYLEDAPLGHLSRFATGIGVCLLVDFFETICQKDK